MSVHSASCQLSTKITMTAPKNISAFIVIEVSPACTSSCSASMSDVMRDDEPAGLLALEEVEAEVEQVAEHARAEIAQERLADPRHEDDRAAPEDQRHDRDDDVQRRREVQRARVSGGDPGVDPVLDQRGPGEEARHLPDDAQGGHARCGPGTAAASARRGGATC